MLGQRIKRWVQVAALALVFGASACGDPPKQDGPCRVGPESCPNACNEGTGVLGESCASPSDCGCGLFCDAGACSPYIGEFAGCQCPGGEQAPTIVEVCTAESVGAPCEDGNPCTRTGVCDASAQCVSSPVGFGVACDDGNPCTDRDTCAGDVCLSNARDDGSVCDDGDLCTVDACVQGQCVPGDPVVCEQRDEQCSVQACDPTTGQCVPNPASEGAACDDGSLCTSDDVCVAGACVGEALDCADVGDACNPGSCNPETGLCQTTIAEDGAPCDGDDLCAVESACLGGRCVTEVERVCDLPCVPNAACNPDTGECEGDALEDGTICDDGDLCTGGDLCQEGLCVGSADLCSCAGQADGAQCDDADPCTTVDTCQDEICVGGGELDCGDLDDACNVGACDRDTGECVAVAVLPGTPCDDEDPCTLDDACNAGVCAGAPLDCSELDTNCGVGVCEGEGECAVQPVEDGTACTNGDACVLGEECTAGVCGGGADQCAACIEALPGDECDDGNPCTEGDACTSAFGRVRCEGALIDCSELDGDCLVGRCDPDNGACFADTAPNGARCDDGDACTSGDFCADGVCNGLDFPVCGEEAAQVCESETPIDSIELSQLLEFDEDDQLLIRGRVEVPGETDWYVVSLVEGQFLSIETGPDCDSELDTFISLRMPDGESVLAFNDDAVGLWSRLEDVEIPETGFYFIQVTSYEDEALLTSYLLRVSQSFPPPCEVDAGCGCDLLLCVLGGEFEEEIGDGVCVPRSPEEVEPNDLPEASAQLAIGEEIMAELDQPTDEDWYALELEQGRPVNIVTLPFCEGPTDTFMRLYDTDGRTELLNNDDIEGSVMAALDHFVPPHSGVFYVQVVGHNFATGAYRVEAQDAGCEDDADCGCEDLVCESDFGLCVPLDPETEPNNSLETAMPIEIGERVSGQISAPREQDNFVLFLPPGRYRVETSALCGAAGDTSLRAKDQEGAVIAEDEDSGQGRFALLEDLVIEEAGFTFIEVTFFGPSQGDYVLVVTER